MRKPIALGVGEAELRREQTLVDPAHIETEPKTHVQTNPSLRFLLPAEDSKFHLDGCKWDVAPVHRRQLLHLLDQRELAFEGTLKSVPHALQLLRAFAVVEECIVSQLLTLLLLGA